MKGNAQSSSVLGCHLLSLWHNAPPPHCCTTIQQDEGVVYHCKRHVVTLGVSGVVSHFWNNSLFKKIAQYIKIAWQRTTTTLFPELLCFCLQGTYAGKAFLKNGALVFALTCDAALSARVGFIPLVLLHEVALPCKSFQRPFLRLEASSYPLRTRSLPAS